MGNLFHSARLRLKAQSLGIRAIDAGSSGGSIDFKECTRVNPLALVKLVQSDPRGYRLAGATRLRFEQELPEVTSRLHFVEQLLDQFALDATEETAA